MPQTLPTEILESLQWRYATKHFDPARRIPAAHWDVIVESARLAPSSYGLQPWRMLQIDDPSLRVKLRTHTWNQAQVTDCSHFLVFTSLTHVDEPYIDRYVERIAAERKVAPDKIEPYRRMMVGDLVNGQRSQIIPFWTQRQAYIALGVILETAALLRIDACPLEGLEPPKYDSVLGLEGTGYSTVAAVALGYRHAEDKYQHLPKVRLRTDELLQIR